MAVLLMRLMLQTTKLDHNLIGRCLQRHAVKPDPTQLSLSASTPKLLYLTSAKGFSTAGDPQGERKQKRRDAFSNTGRKISERIIRVLDEKGMDLGMMHRADVIRLMNKQDLRLVQRNTSSEPPEYQLMTGEQIHQERLKLREQEKAKPKTGPTMTKELVFSSNIGQHDLDTKSKQIQQWIEKKYHVQVTIKRRKDAEQSEEETVSESEHLQGRRLTDTKKKTAEKLESLPRTTPWLPSVKLGLEEIFNQILQTMPDIATFSSRPKAIRGGTASMCVFRHLSKKEEKAYRESQESQRRDTLSKDDDENSKESDVVCQ